MLVKTSIILLNALLNEHEDHPKPHVAPGKTRRNGADRLASGAVADCSSHDPAEAAVRAGLSRNTAYRLEKGDASLAVGQILRYLDAIFPGKTLLGLLQEDDPALAALAARGKRQRVRELSREEKDKLDF